MSSNVLGGYFRQVWCVDFEFQEVKSNPPIVHCLVARELFSGKLVRQWVSDRACPCPIPLDRESLYVAYFAPAELKCHLSLGWPLPFHVLDLYVEFRCLTNGLELPAGKGLLGALSYFGLASITYTEKESMRELAIRGSPFSALEQRELIDYCQGDVDALIALLPHLAEKLHLQQALLRGRYIKAVSRMENHGVPIDTSTLHRLQSNWDSLKGALIHRVNANYGVFEGNTFKRELFAAYLRRKKLAWPTLPSGQLDLKDSTFRQMARVYPSLSPLRELRHSLGKLQLHQLTAGNDRRSRVNLSPFSSKTGRNQPSNSRYIFGSSVWLRGLIRAQPGWGVAYIDWSQQEFGIAGALSGDPAMLQAYHSGDPYLEFAKQAGLVPLGATKQTHPQQRKLCKAAVLAVQYGMGAGSLADSINEPVQMGRELLANHKRTFPVFWKWSQGVQDFALLHLKLWTVFGWNLRVGREANVRSLANFPMQANGAEILRLACIYMVEAGIRVCAPVHDAVLIEAPVEQLTEQICRAQALMAKASRDVLSGFELNTDVEMFSYPERYCDVDRGREFWMMVMEELEKCNG